MSNERQEGALVQGLAGSMARKLRVNAHKPHWETLSHRTALRLLKLEVEELERAIETLDYNRSSSTLAVMNECADVANFAAFIHENVLLEK